MGFLTVIACIIGVGVLLLFVGVFGKAARHLLGDGEELNTPGQWIKTIILGIIVFVIVGWLLHKPGCNNEREAEYELERSRDPGY